MIARRPRFKAFRLALVIAIAAGAMLAFAAPAMAGAGGARRRARRPISCRPKVQASSPLRRSTLAIRRSARKRAR